MVAKLTLVTRELGTLFAERYLNNLILLLLDSSAIWGIIAGVSVIEDEPLEMV